MVRQMISEWPTSTMDEFQKTLTEKDAAGCFDIPKEKAIGTHYQGGPQEVKPRFNTGGGGQWGRGRNRGRGRGNNRGRGRGLSGGPPQTRTGCFNCGEEGHWRNQCPYETFDTNGQQAQSKMTSSQGNGQQDQGVRYPIQWTQPKQK